MATEGKKDFRLTMREDFEAGTISAVYLNREGQEVGRRAYAVGDIAPTLVNSWQSLGDTEMRLVFYGIAKVLQDRTSDLVKLVKENGPEVRLEGMDAVWATLQTEGWNARRGEGGGSATLKKSTLYEAIARVKGCSVAEAGAAYRKLSEEQAETVRNSEAVRKALEDIRAEAQGPADLTDLL